jgi:putative NIF3 family GTP cyclohydrolase 1 type 2
MSIKNQKKRKNKIYKDKNGKEFIKETYFIGGKQKSRRIYVIDGIPADEFYKRNATDFDFYLNGDYELINSENDSNKHSDPENKKKADLSDKPDVNDLPF